MGRLDGKIAIVTGAGGGIGFQTAAVFVQEGAKVTLADISEEALTKVENFLVKEFPGASVLKVKCDVSSEEQVKSLVGQTVEKFGKLDIMFNNAGIMHPKDDNSQNTPMDIWDKTHDINVKGVFYGCKYAIEAMLNNPNGGSIINTASFVAVVGAATPQIAYTASKGAVLAMTRELAVVHAKDNIRVNNLCPGPIRTPLLMDFLNTQEKKDRRLVHVPMGRFGEAIEQAKAVLFLASDDSSYVTGTDLMVDGGLSAAYVTPLGEPKVAPPKGFEL